MRPEEELIDERLTLVGREIAGDDFRLTPAAKKYLVAVINRLPRRSREALLCYPMAIDRPTVADRENAEKDLSCPFVRNVLDICSAQDAWVPSHVANALRNHDSEDFFKRIGRDIGQKGFRRNMRRWAEDINTFLRRSRIFGVVRGTIASYVFREYQQVYLHTINNTRPQSHLSRELRRKLSKIGCHSNADLYRLRMSSDPIWDNPALSRDDIDMIENYLAYWVDSYFFVAALWC